MQIQGGLADTAGLNEETADFIEIQGMRRTRINAVEADIRLLMIVASGASFRDGSVSRETFFAGFLPKVAGSAATSLLRSGDFVLLNKIDAVDAPDGAGIPRQLEGDSRMSLTVFPVSVRTGAGIDALVAALTAAAARRCGRADEAALTRVRHVEAVEAAIRHLSRAKGRLAMPELAAEDVRLAARELGKITGAVGVEDILDAIFSSFCIGK